MYIRLAATAGMLASAVVLSACGAATSNVSWQESLRESLDKEFETLSSQELADACLGFAMFDLDTPAEIGAIVFAFDETGELPEGNVTVAEWAEEGGADLDDLPFDIDPDLTVREVANEAGAYMLDQCGVDYE